MLDIHACIHEHLQCVIPLNVCSFNRILNSCTDPYYIYLHIYTSPRSWKRGLVNSSAVDVRSNPTFI